VTTLAPTSATLCRRGRREGRRVLTFLDQHQVAVVKFHNFRGQFALLLKALLVSLEEGMLRGALKLHISVQTSLILLFRSG